MLKRRSKIQLIIDMFMTRFNLGILVKSPCFQPVNRLFFYACFTY